MRLTYTIIFLIVLSCKNKQPEIAIPSNQKEIIAKKTDVSECMPPDTSFGTGSIKYIKEDSVFQVQVWMSKRDTTLPYVFDCSAPAGVVPQLYSYSKDIICLLRGYGQDYRVFVVCHLENGKIIFKEFETAMFTDLKNGRVVYQKYDDPAVIYVEDVRTGKRKNFTITSETIYSHFREGKIENDRLILYYGDSKFTFPLK